MTCHCSSEEEHARRQVESAYASARSSEEYYKGQIGALEAKLRSMTPDPTRFEIIDAMQVGSAMVIKARFPSCAECAYEGDKVLVYRQCTPIDALKWRRLDPHFRPQKRDRSPAEAPSPDARFPASPEGWTDAQAYARSKT